MFSPLFSCGSIDDLHAKFYQLERLCGSKRILLCKNDFPEPIITRNYFFNMMKKNYFSAHTSDYCIAFSLENFHDFFFQTIESMKTCSREVVLSQSYEFTYFVFSQLFTELCSHGDKSFFYDIAFFYIQFSNLPLDDLFTVVDRMYKKILEYLAAYHVHNMLSFSVWVKDRWYIVPIAAACVLISFLQWRKKHTGKYTNKALPAYARSLPAYAKATSGTQPRRSHLFSPWGFGGQGPLTRMGIRPPQR
ncbi:MAG: hypothetical protein UU47_C0003G0070 [candidate division TM6 bacterium GW2011_GWE2_41_16]|nr:MAG: hypothetical protein UU47_C0003G0070 [candidate division TM6 bacterium GW2011_GWE2_41_16]